MPCYNEAKRLRLDLFSDCLQENQQIDFLFCNDGSTDNTQQILEAFKLQSPQRITLIQRQQNSGKAEAVRTGMLHASLNEEYTFIGYWDADLATPLTELPRLLLELANNLKKVAFSSRIKRMGANVERKELRHYLGRIFSTFSSIILKLPVYDSQCGAKVFHRETTTLFQKPFLSSWLFDVEILARFRNDFGIEHALLSIAEVPVENWQEIPGSKLKFSHYLRVPLDLWKIHREYNKKHKTK